MRWPASLRRRRLAVLGLAAVIGWQVPRLVSAASRSRPASSKSAAEASADAASHKQIQARLDQILTNQVEILARFDAVMEELRVVKIRATQ